MQPGRPAGFFLIEDSLARDSDAISTVTLQMTMLMEVTAVRLLAEAAVLR